MIFVRRIVDDRVVDDRVLDAKWENADNDCTIRIARGSLRLVALARGSQSTLFCAVCGRKKYYDRND